MIGRLIADDIDNRHPGTPGVVQICETVREARAAVQERGRRLAGHTRITVGGARGHALEQAKSAANPGNAIES